MGKTTFEVAVQIFKDFSLEVISDGTDKAIDKENIDADNRESDNYDADNYEDDNDSSDNDSRNEL